MREQPMRDRNRPGEGGAMAQPALARGTYRPHIHAHPTRFPCLTKVSGNPDAAPAAVRVGDAPVATR